MLLENTLERKNSIMLNIIKEELPIEKSLKRKLELMCEFSKTTTTIITWNIRKIDKTAETLTENNKALTLNDNTKE